MAFVTGTGLHLTARDWTAPAAREQRQSSLFGKRVIYGKSNRESSANLILPRNSSNYSMAYGETVKEVIEGSKKYPTLVKLAKSCNFDLNVTGTVFLPNEAAFARLPKRTVQYLLGDQATARAVLAYHVYPLEMLTLAKIKGCGFFEGIVGGMLSYEGLGAVIRVGNARVINETSNVECKGAYIHEIDSVLVPPGVTLPSLSATFAPSVPRFTDNIAESAYTPISPKSRSRELGACAPASTGGRKAMGLISQLPFYMYGPPFNAAKQEDYEPISIAEPQFAGVDYQVLPPGSVIVQPDSVNASELNPVSGMSKYIGKTKRLVEGDALSDYSRLDE